MTIKAIETQYKGYRFRSRLEARWAVFFDTLGIKWQYEKEGIDLGNGIKYLPDFWIPLPSSKHFGERGYFVEIKPIALTQEQANKCILLANKSGHSVCALCGDIWPDELTQIKFLPNGNQLDCSINEFYISYPCASVLSENDLPYDFYRAFISARSARFEYGERGSA